MEKCSKQLFLLKDEKIWKSLLILGIPSMIGMMVSALYNVVDTYFVGRLGTSQMGAVSIVYPLSMVILGISLLFGCGAGNNVSRLLGEKKYDEASKYASTALFTSLSIGTILVIIMILFLTPLLNMLGSTDTMMVYAKEYAVIFIIGLILNSFNATFNNIISSEGTAIYGMAAMVAGGIANVILDPILIITFNLGVRGAAIATLISRIISFVIYLSYLKCGKSLLKFSIRNIIPSKEIYIPILKLGIPMLIFQLLTSVALSLTNYFASYYGDFAVAGLSVVSRIMSLVNMAVFGFLKGYQPIVAYNYGANNKERVEKSTKLCLLWTTTFCILVSAIMIIFNKQVLGMFTENDLEVIKVGTKGLILNSIVFIFMGYQAVYSHMFLGFGMAKEGGLISIGRQGVFFIPIILILTAVLNLNGIILAQPLADCFSVLLVFILNRRYRKNLSNESNLINAAV